MRGADDGAIRVGLVGLGSIAHQHTEFARDLGAEIVAGLDVSPDARDRYEEAFGLPTCCDFDDLLARDPDAIIVTTPNCYHEEYAVGALDAGVHVLCEKPLAHTVESAERIVTAANAADATLMVGFNFRFSPPAECVRAAIDAGRLGEVLHVDANFLRRRGVPGRGSWFTKQELAGGGALVDIGVHALDLALYLLGYPEVVEVSGRVRSLFGNRSDYTYDEMWGDDLGPGEFDVDDSATAFISCADGRTVSLSAAWAVNRDPNDEFVVEGTESGARFGLEGSEATFYDVRRGDSTNPLPTHREKTGDHPSHRAELAYFFDCIREDRPVTRNTPEEGLVVQRVVDAIYRSSESGRAVAVSGDTGESDHPWPVDSGEVAD